MHVCRALVMLVSDKKVHAGGLMRVVSIFIQIRSCQCAKLLFAAQKSLLSKHVTMNKHEH